MESKSEAFRLVMGFSVFILVIACVAMVLYSSNKSTGTADAAEETVPTIEVVSDDETADPFADFLARNPEGMYMVKEPYLKSVGGFCVEREGKLYSLGSLVPIDNMLRYDVGYSIASGSPDAALFLMDEKASEIPTKEPLCHITAGDMPILKVRKNELIRGYGVYDLRLYAAEFYGWTVEVSETLEGVFPVLNYNIGKADEATAKAAKTSFGVYETISGRQVEDFRHLNYGEDYTFAWQDDSGFHKESMLADCKAFRVIPSDNVAELEPINIIGGVTTQNGYKVFDISGLPTGTYMMADRAAVFEVVD